MTYSAVPHRSRHSTYLSPSSIQESDGQPRFPRHVLESNGPLWTFFPTLRAPLLVCLLLGALFPVPSLSCFSFPTRAGLCCGGDGAPRFLSVLRSLGVGWTLWFRSLTILVGPRPFLLLPSSPLLRCVVFWLIIASCGTGWASTSSCNIRPPFHKHLSTTGSMRFTRGSLPTFTKHTGRAYSSQDNKI